MVRRKNTRGVTSFVGPGSKPVALTDAEVLQMGLESVNVEDLGFEEGDTVYVISGPFCRKYRSCKGNQLR